MYKNGRRYHQRRGSLPISTAVVMLLVVLRLGYWRVQEIPSHRYLYGLRIPFYRLGQPWLPQSLGKERKEPTGSNVFLMFFIRPTMVGLRL